MVGGGGEVREADVAVAVGGVEGDGDVVVFLGGLEGGEGVRGDLWVVVREVGLRLFSCRCCNRLGCFEGLGSRSRSWGC